MAGHIADGMFLRASLTRDERFDRFWDLVALCIDETDWTKPKYNDAEWVTLYLTTIVVNEYGNLDEARLNGIARGLYHIAHRAVERNWWCIKAVAGNSIYTDPISVDAVNYLIDRLAIGCRRATPNAKVYPLVRRIPEFSRMR
jgi:hypothetical protein